MPGDKSMSHRAAILAGLGEGACEISGFLASEDCLASAGAMRALGADVEFLSEDRTRLLVTGTGLNLMAPEEAIDCGNSGTTMRLLSGVLAAQFFRSRLFGDESLSRRPMGRVIDPLTAMGGRITGTGEKRCSPLDFLPTEGVEPMRYELPVASAQVKSAVLLMGLFAKGKTTVVEPKATRDHSERMMAHFGVKTVRIGKEISIYGGQVPRAEAFYVPGDISSAAFWAVVAAASDGAKLAVKGVGLNATRTGVLKVLVRMGAQVSEHVEASGQGEPFGTVSVRGVGLQGTEIKGDEIPNVIDELPVLAVAGALAQGRTVIRDAAELRVKESDRIKCVADNLRAMGVAVREFDDGMEIEGGGRLKGARIASYGDHRIAMAFAVAGLFADGETIIEDTGCVATSYPGFERDLGKILTGRLGDDAGDAR